PSDIWRRCSHPRPGGPDRLLLSRSARHECESDDRPSRDMISTNRCFPARAAVVLLSAALLSYPQIAAAQRADALGPQARKVLRVTTPRVVLEHVEVIDGTGAAPIPDRNVVIEGGKITAISAGADVSPSDGTTVLDLRGYSVMPGIVGMHNHLFCFVRANL